MKLPLFFRIYFTWPTLAVAAGSVLTFVWIGLYTSIWERPSSEIILIGLLTIEMWLFPYIMLPAAFLISERLPWNKKLSPLWNGEGMGGLVVGIFVYAYFCGVGTYFGFLAAAAHTRFLDQVLTGLRVGAVAPIIILAGIAIIIFFPGEAER
ncbi:hypothetical protein JYU02_00135 [bacterium AH-315-P15]|nr:hypothetical protein [bacterium AH-315-P15]